MTPLRDKRSKKEMAGAFSQKLDFYIKESGPIEKSDHEILRREVIDLVLPLRSDIDNWQIKISEMERPHKNFDLDFEYFAVPCFRSEAIESCLEINDAYYYYQFRISGESFLSVLPVILYSRWYKRAAPDWANEFLFRPYLQSIYESLFDKGRRTSSRVIEALGLEDRKGKASALTEFGQMIIEMRIYSIIRYFELNNAPRKAAVQFIHIATGTPIKQIENKYRAQKRNFKIG